MQKHSEIRLQSCKRHRKRFFSFKNRINIANFLSYIPIIRIGVGVWRIYSHIPLIMERGVSDFTEERE